MYTNSIILIQGLFPGGMPNRTALLISPHTQPSFIFQPMLNKNNFIKTTHVIQKSGVSSYQINSGRVNLTSTGTAMPDEVLQMMENVFDTDFSDVRIHTGGYQAESMGALAFTSGNNIFFANGRYNPDSTYGRKLLGHELAHVVQQKKGFVKSPFEKGIAVVNNPRFEAEAERFALKSAQTFEVIQRQATNFFSGVIQLGKPKKSTKSRATVKTRHKNTTVRKRKKFHPTFEHQKSRRLIKISGPLKPTKRGRKNKNKFKTTDVSGPVNDFLLDAGIERKALTFEGGHLLGDVFKGPNSENNVIPMPFNFNRVAYKKEENKIKNLLKGTKKNPKNESSSMEIEITYPDNPLEGLIDKKAMEKLKKKVTDDQYGNLEKLFEKVPSKIEWIYNDPTGSQKVTFSNIRNDLLTKTRQKSVVNNSFLNAVKKL